MQCHSTMCCMRTCALLVLQSLAISLTLMQAAFSQRDFLLNTTRLQRRHFNITSPTTTRQDYVRLKLQTFIFEVTHYLKAEKSDASGHLRRLMKPYPHILLDPGYTSTLITSYHPLSIQTEICRQFQAARRKTHEHVPTSIFVVNDIGAMVNRPRHDRLLQLFFQITASLGLPTLTWMPNRIGEFELEETQLATRLEPLTWHVARALVDFSHAFNWNVIIFLYNIHAPGSGPLMSEMKLLQTERAKQDHPNYYEFEVDAYLPFDGFTKHKLKDCTLVKGNGGASCFDSLLAAMQRIWESVSRVIIFNGNQYDLNALMYIADTLEGTMHEHLGELFGTGYVWIFTPSTMAPLTIVDQVETVNRDSIVLSEFTMFRKIPGMFGLVCLNDADNRKRHAELAREVWHKSLMELVKQEQPLLIYGKLQEDGSCDANSVACWIGEDSETRQGRQLACCTGLTMDLLMELMKDLNFEVELYEVKDRLWGGWTGKDWNGLVRELMEHKADMAITSLKITPSRSEQIDFSVPFLETGIAITVALREGAISPTAFLEPYDYQCWCIILLFSVHASGAAIYLYEWLSPAGQDRGRLVTPEHRFTMCRSLWLIWSMLFGAAVNADNPRGMASRFMANIWALFALVFLASYTANLAAFMISKDDFYDLNGIHDWRLQQPWNHKPPFRFATVPSGATEENIKINFPEMAAYMHAFNRTTVVEGLKSLKSQEIDAFIYDATVLEYWTSRDDGCKLKTVGNLYAMTGYGIGFPKGSRWLPKINSRILHYQKNVHAICRRKIEASGDDREILTEQVPSLEAVLAKCAFILLLCGMLLCGVMFVMEHVFYGYIWRRIQASDRYGCCALAVVKPTKSNDSEDEGPRACLNERHRSRQEITKLSRCLRFHTDEVTTDTEGSADQPQRNAVALPSSAIISAQRPQVSAMAACTVIRIPRTSWSKDNYVNRDSHPIHSIQPSPQHLQIPPSSRRVPPNTLPTPATDVVGDAKLQEALESHGGSEGCKELANRPHSTASQSCSHVSRPDIRPVNECVEKESVI
ncbi:Glutamate receptor ionotropic NMDA 2A [Taenia crassiceps]|uniref:Glutamate receptor ionotropic NMDA 2A n=1 Tax=Taenia crassiceps TaxID=6207 RepID=A0ABR4Q2V8_9CEST